MALVADELATKLKEGLGFASQPNTPQMKGVAQGIIQDLTVTGLVNFLPGTIMGTAPPSGGPLIGGTGSGGLIIGISGATMGAFIASFSGMPPTPQVLGKSGAIATHTLTGTVTLPTVTGVCSNTPTSPGVLVGEAMGGKIGGLNGASLFGLMSAAVGGGSPELKAMCDSLVDYIQQKAEVTFLTGTITGVCSAGGGPITLGAGVGGKIS